jgi:hypothetical protein
LCLIFFVLLGNFGAANGMVEMLIQSQGDELVQVNIYKYKYKYKYILFCFIIMNDNNKNKNISFFQHYHRIGH